MTRSRFQTFAGVCAWASVVVMVLSIGAAAAHGQWVSDADQAAFRKLWPASVNYPAGMWAYKPTEHSQRIAVTNNRESNSLYRLTRDDVWSNSPTAVNPNRIFPWAASGGLHASTGWSHLTAISLPSAVHARAEKVPIKNGGKITGMVWSFPDGTVTADMLIKDGKVFELRTRTKIGGDWQSRVVHRDMTLSPVGFKGAGKRCAECHDHAGSSLQYGIMLRGADTVFSFSPYDFSE